MKSHFAAVSEKKSVEAELPAFRHALTAWFRKNGRNLPWRQAADPYAVLVSEMMLQQTQVATVIAYFERWLKRFPSVERLAAAPEEEVLELWQGLGYYSRARNLHKAAKALVSMHGGVFPQNREALQALPGVGPYTAAAVATFAFDLPEPPIDGNIARVLARLTDYRSPVDSARGMNDLRATALRWQPEEKAGFFNEAMMELGALICTPRSPQCGACPVSSYCAATDPATLPIKKPRPKVIPLDEPSGWAFHNGCVLLEQQTGRRWHGLWKLPQLAAPPGNTEPLLTLHYPFTHHRITLRVYPASELREGDTRQWHALSSLAALPMTAPHRRAVEQLLALPSRR